MGDGFALFKWAGAVVFVQDDDHDDSQLALDIRRSPPVSVFFPIHF